METLPKDIQKKLVLEFSPPDLINFCLVNKGIYDNICNSKDFWRQKLAIDFPYVTAYFVTNNLVLVNPKNTYIKKFTEVSQKIEKFVNEEFKSDLEIMYQSIYSTYIKLLQNPHRNFYINEIFSHEKFRSMQRNDRIRYINSMYKQIEKFSKRFNKLIDELLNKDKSYGIIRYKKQLNFF